MKDDLPDATGAANEGGIALDAPVTFIDLARANG